MEFWHEIQDKYNYQSKLIMFVPSPFTKWVLINDNDYNVFP